MSAAKLLPENFTKPSKEKKAKHLPAPYKLRRYYTPKEVATHNTANDCWVSFFDEVYDLTQLIQKHYGAEVEPLIKAAGIDITHWFDAKTREPKTYVDPFSNITQYYVPNGRYLHIPPAEPDTEWDNSFSTP
jgi:cytochrome b involved in lipid metabolism